MLYGSMERPREQTFALSELAWIALTEEQGERAAALCEDARQSRTVRET